MTFTRHVRAALGWLTVSGLAAAQASTAARLGGYVAKGIESERREAAKRAAVNAAAELLSALAALVPPADRDLDAITIDDEAHAHDLDEDAVAAVAPEGADLDLVDVPAAGADVERSGQSAERSACSCVAPVVAVAWVNVSTMRAVEDSWQMCSRCGGRVSASGMVQ